MKRTDLKYQQCVELLRKELIPATGCTEPVAIAYAAASAKRLLGTMPQQVLVQVSGNILKNAKSVIIPGAGGLFGIPAAAAAGIVAGDPDRQLDVISHFTEEQTGQVKQYLADTPIRVEGLDTLHLFDILVTLTAGEEQARVRITGHHTNITLLEKNGQVLDQSHGSQSSGEEERALTISLRDIFDFAQEAQLEDVRETLELQMRLNWAIAEEGMRSGFGAAIGRIISQEGSDPKTQAKAYAAAASDARMSGCDMPVVINSGSGNQGICASVPVIAYARALDIPEEELYRALLLSNLAAIYQKRMIGTLSAYCGAVSAGAAAGAGIAFMLERDYSAVIHTLVNALAITSGIVCDGAKPSCAGKIAMSAEAGILGYQMYKQGTQFRGGEGILASNVEITLRNVARLARDGMFETDKEILRIMLES